MSYNIKLMGSNEKIVTVEPHTEGSIIQLGGNIKAEMSVTYNYSPYFYEYLCPNYGLRSLDGVKACDALELLRRTVSHLGTETDPDYWKNTPGNAGKALQTLVEWSEQHPQATIYVK